MKKLLIVFYLLVLTTSLFAQKDSITSSDHYVKHLSFQNTFWGDEDQFQVCYPKDHKMFFYFIIGFGITAVVLGALIIRVKTNANKKLKDKNCIIEEQNKDMLDSINYARRIQQAILPDKEDEKNILRNGFALYKPKNIVSGDFYWLHKQDDHIYIAVIDCTGHGVPGALLTILGYNAINKAVVEKQFTNPSQILDFMNEDIKSALKQNQNQHIQDSMEVALACFNPITNELMFAGANLSLHIVSDGKINSLKGNKCTVGSIQAHVQEAPLLQSITLKMNDSFYMFSDGIVDQFGGKEGKKLKTNVVKEFIVSIQEQSMADQKNSVNTFVENWKGNTEQTDDITLIGFRVD